MVSCAQRTPRRGALHGGCGTPCASCGSRGRSTSTFYPRRRHNRRRGIPRRCHSPAALGHAQVVPVHRNKAWAVGGALRLHRAFGISISPEGAAEYHQCLKNGFVSSFLFFTVSRALQRYSPAWSGVPVQRPARYVGLLCSKIRAASARPAADRSGWWLWPGSTLACPAPDAPTCSPYFARRGPALRSAALTVASGHADAHRPTCGSQLCSLACAVPFFHGAAQ